MACSFHFLPYRKHKENAETSSRGLPSQTFCEWSDMVVIDCAWMVVETARGCRVRPPGRQSQGPASGTSWACPAAMEAYCRRSADAPHSDQVWVGIMTELPCHDRTKQNSPRGRTHNSQSLSHEWLEFFFLPFLAHIPCAWTAERLTAVTNLDLRNPKREL